MVWKDNHSLTNQQSFTLNTERQQQNRQILTSQEKLLQGMSYWIVLLIHFSLKNEKKYFWSKQKLTVANMRNQSGYIVWAELDIC